MKRCFLLIALLLCLGCAKSAQSSMSHGNFQVDLCFEKDGYKVYRFYDAGQWRYYVVPEGVVMQDISDGESTVENSIYTTRKK